MRRVKNAERAARGRDGQCKHGVEALRRIGTISYNKWHLLARCAGLVLHRERTRAARRGMGEGPRLTA